MKKATYILAPIAIASFLILGCDTTARDWEKTQQLNTIEAYQTFRESHPTSSYDSLASVKIEELSWEKVIDEGALEAFQKFIEDFPQSEHVAEAIRISDELLWGRALETGTIDAYEEYLSRFPNGHYADKLIVDVNKSWFSEADIGAGSTIPPDAVLNTWSGSLGFSGIFMGGRLIPDRSSSISGTIETSVGSVRRSAGWSKWQRVYADTSRSAILGWVGCVVRGELILSLVDLVGGPSGRFVENSFEAESIGENWLLVKLDPKQGHLLCFEVEVGSREVESTANYPGTVVTTGRGIFTRKADGWYFTPSAAESADGR